MHKRTFPGKTPFRFCKQLEMLDCGPACLKMIASSYGKRIDLGYLREVCKTSRIGTSLKSMLRGAAALGLDGYAAEIRLENLEEDLPLPCILHWQKKHFVVLLQVIPAGRYCGGLWHTKKKYVIADPAFGIIHLPADSFTKMWYAGQAGGIAVFFEPNESFTFPAAAHAPPEANLPGRYYLGYLLRLVKEHRWGFIQVFAGMLVSSALFLAFPILTQRLVDVGVRYKSTDFVTLVLLAQLFVFLGIATIDSVKAWILLHIGTKLEIQLTAGFLAKIMKLPLYFFDSKLTGDLLQRISDNTRIETFIKSYLLDFLMSAVTFLALLLMMYQYSITVFLLYLGGTALSVTWVIFFLRQRELLDYRKFDFSSENTDNLIENVVAMPEIKLNNAENVKKRKWEEVQVKLFDVNVKLLSLQQYQNIGNNTINQIKNIAISFVAAMLVIENQMTLGIMLSISFMLGQLNGPLNQIVNFFQFFQDAKISFRRLSEVQVKEEEGARVTGPISEESFGALMSHFSVIRCKNLAFSYTESVDELVFENLNLSIERGKVTAIVGTSGSGKTTLVKMLLKFYEPLSGSITVGGVDFRQIKADTWRRSCGVVLQEGHIFSDTISGNVAMSDYEIDQERVRYACRMACIADFVEELPMGYDTPVGSRGVGLSTGQKQRILIARAIYKNPEILFFDEATSSLDARNEKQIVQNLNEFFRDRTVVIVAHRLSTVRNADNIIVVDKGAIVEFGSHDYLVEKEGFYFNLIKNQLELGQ